MDKKTLIYIAIAIALMYIIYSFVLKPQKEQTIAEEVAIDPATGGNSPTRYNHPSDEQLTNYFSSLINIYGPQLAKKIEQIYRLETAHFTSGQYLATGSPGMLSFDDNYPYGWSSPKPLWDYDENMRPIGKVTFNKNGKSYTYLVFPNFYAAARTVGEHIKKFRPGRWYSTDPIKQTEYENKLNTITTKFT